MKLVIIDDEGKHHVVVHTIVRAIQTGYGPTYEVNLQVESGHKISERALNDAVCEEIYKIHGSVMNQRSYETGFNGMPLVERGDGNE